jgi:glutamyl-Q tRNA(Asp) synthetase
MEDLDTPRVVPGSAVRIVDDLTRLGLRFDGDVVVQSERTQLYDDALTRLRDAGLLYACACSRKELARIASAPHVGDEGPPYPGTCRHKGLPFDDPALPVAWRFVVPPGSVVVHDALCGTFAQDVAAEVGDVVVKRKDGVYAYQLAVVVDDGLQGITEVVRGRDLLASAPRQVLLHQALGFAPPTFAHLPLWVDDDGHRLSKRSGETPTLLRAWLDRVGPEGVLGMMARALGVGDGAPLDVDTLLARLDDTALSHARITDAGPLPEG